MTFLYLAVLLIGCYFFLVAEFLLPSGGILGAFAFALLTAAIVIAFTHSIAVGITVTVIVLVTGPLLLMGLVRAWPHTPIGRRMLNRRPGETAQTIPRRTTSRGTPIDSLVGRIGIAKTNLLPSGLVVIDGEKVDAVSIGMPIDAGTEVIATHIELGRLHVREATDQDHPRSEPPPPQSPPSLEGSLESLDIEG